MKKNFLLVLVLACAFPAFAQLTPLPIDPAIRYGKLPNGLTYYIKANAEPKGQAEFFIAQKVGSVQEEENQLGLAHFLEHMCFNGTKNFPDKALFTFLEGIGVKFGENLNAYTSIEETVYNISSVPVKRSGIIDSCLLILHDWSNALSLTDKEINEERGVIREEMRQSDGPEMRMYRQISPELYPNSRYGTRWPIGTAQVIENFLPSELRDYYHKWYRPDHQAIIVVGDIDVDDIEKRIKTLFADIAAPAEPSPLVKFPVEDNEAPIIVTATDPEARMTMVGLDYRFDPIPDEVRLSVQGMALSYMIQVLQEVLNERLFELSQKANAPYTNARASIGSYFLSSTKDALSFDAQTSDNGAQKALEAIATEAARLKRFGITAGEYERAKSEILANYERAYNERAKRYSESYAREYARHFISSEAIPGIEVEYTTINQLAPMFTAEQISGVAQELVQDKNISISVLGPQKDGVTYPSKEEILAIYQKAFNATDIKAIEDKVSNEPLMTKAPKAGKVVSETKDAEWDATVWTLNNGIKVIVKPTDFKDDEITMNASAPGGYSLMEEKDLLNAMYIGSAIGISGVGQYPRTDLTKMLSGKKVSVSTNVTEAFERLSGFSVKKDLETFMQLVYLTATSTYKDVEAFEAFIARQKAQLANEASNPMAAFMDSLRPAIFGKHRQPDLTLDNIGELNYDRILAMYKERFANMGDFTFTFVGNLDLKTFKPLVETYLGSLPSSKKADSYNVKNLSTPIMAGPRQNIFERPMATPIADVSTTFTGKIDYTPENDLLFSVFSQVLDIIFTREIREKEGGTYGVAVQGNVNKLPESNYVLLIYFQTEPAKREHLLKAVYREINNLAQNGPQKEDFDKVIAFEQKQLEENLRNNQYWLSQIDHKVTMGVNKAKDYASILDKITPKMVQDMCKKVLGDNNPVEVIQSGVAMN